MHKRLRTNPLSHHSAMPFPRNSKIPRAGLESQPFPRQDQGQRQPGSGADHAGSPQPPQG